MDRLGSIVAFVHSAEGRSFTVAGRQLGISSSAVGKAIARLEERLGTRLFHRSTRSISLTPEGEAFLQRCQNVLAEIEAAEVELAKRKGAASGLLRVGLPLVGALMMPALNAFAEAYPEIRLDLDFSDRLVDVVEEGFDAVIRSGAASDSRLKTRTLGDYRLAIVASPDYLDRCGTPRVPQDLLGHACLQHRWTTSGKLSRWPLLLNGEELHLDLPATVVSTSLDPLIDMAMNGRGITCVPTFAVARLIVERKLVPVLSQYVGGGGTFRILWPSSRHDAPKVKVFVDYMAANLFRLAPDLTPEEGTPLSEHSVLAA